jgi:hypothetical protein
VDSCNMYPFFRPPRSSCLFNGLIKQLRHSSVEQVVEEKENGCKRTV